MTTTIRKNGCQKGLDKKGGNHTKIIASRDYLPWSIERHWSVMKDANLKQRFIVYLQINSYDHKREVDDHDVPC